VNQVANDRRGALAGLQRVFTGASLRRPIAWVLVFAAAVGIAVPLLLLHVADSLNEEALSGSTAVARTAIDSLAAADRSTVYDYTHWDEAFEQLTGPLDPDWADANLGSYLGENFQIAGSLVLAADGRAIYAWAGQPTLAPLDRGTLRQALDQLAVAVRADPTGPARHDYLTLGAEVFLASASVVQRPAGDPPPGAPVLIIVRALNRALLERIGGAYVLDGLRVVTPDAPPHRGEAVLGLSGLAGAPVGTIAWRPDWPGDRLFWSFGVPVTALLYLIIVLMLVNLRRIQHYARQVAAANLSLSEREAEARGARARAETADQAKTSFLANMSHELRTPLNAVLGFCELLETELYGALNQKQREYLGDIQASGRHLLGIINDILDTARLGAGRYQLAPEPLVVAHVVDECLRFVHGRAVEGGVGLHNAVDPLLPRLVADPRALRQVIINLAGNAVKFTPSGGLVRVEATVEASGDLALAVIDNGTGIPPESLARLFQPFQQGDTTLARRHEGTGLGLTISRELMALHGGTLAIESEFGKGTSAIARFPAGRLYRDEAPAPPSPAAPAAAAPPEASDGSAAPLRRSA
jgi:signal transduction histidine kinase